MPYVSTELTAGTIYKTQYIEANGGSQSRTLQPILQISGGSINVYSDISNTPPASTATMSVEVIDPVDPSDPPVVKEFTSGPAGNARTYKFDGEHNYFAYEVASGSPVVLVSGGLILEEV